MDFLKKIIWLIIIVSVLGAVAFAAFYTRFLMVSNNYSDYWKRQALENGNFIYIALGDSRALGVGATTPTRSYVGIISDRIYQSTGSIVKTINLSGIKGLDDVIENQIPKLSEYDPDIITISVGSKEVQDGVRKEELLLKIGEVIDRLPIEKIYFAELPTFYDKKKDEIAKDINKSIHTLAEDKGIVVVPLHRMTEKLAFDISTYDLDLSHPNDKGYEVWAEAFWNSIQ